MARPVIKVCGMRDAANIAAVGACKPDFVGFIFVPESPRFCREVLSRSAVDALPKSVKTIGVFRNARHDDVIEAVEEFKLSGVQLHGDEDRSYLSMLRRDLAGKVVFKAISVRDMTDIEMLTTKELPVDGYIFDSARGGSGERFEWSHLAHYRGVIPFLLAGGIGLDNLRSARELQQWCPQLQGFDLNSKFEDAPGLKNAALIKKAIEMVSL
jgi:phosphoribosylanthranilate isomerase